MPRHPLQVDEDVYVSLLKIQGDLSAREKKLVKMSDVVRFLITFNPTVELEKLPLRHPY